MAHQHNHSHEHDHSHFHYHANERSTRIVVLISAATMLLELLYGYQTKSIALIMEGWHMLSHVLVLLLAWAAYIYIGRRGKEVMPEQRHRVIALSSFASSITLLLVTIFMMYESVLKFMHLEVDVSTGALVVAIIGLVVNGLSAYFLHREEEKWDLNLRAAYMHVLSDVLLSVLAIVSLLAAQYFQLYILDPICGLLGALVILKWSVELIRKSWVEVVGFRNKHSH